MTGTSDRYVVPYSLLSLLGMVVLGACDSDLPEHRERCHGPGVPLYDGETSSSTNVEVSLAGELFEPLVDGTTVAVEYSGSGIFFLPLNIRLTGFYEYGEPDVGDASGSPLTKISGYFSADDTLAIGRQCALSYSYSPVGEGPEPLELLGGNHRFILLSGPTDDIELLLAEPIRFVVEVLDVHGVYGRREVTLNLSR